MIKVSFLVMNIKIKFTKSQDKLIYIEAFFKKEASTVNFDIDC